MDDSSLRLHAHVATAAEAVARGWALLVTVGVTLALPVLHLTRDDDEHPDDHLSDPSSLLSTIPRVVLASVEDFQREDPGNLGTKLAILRVVLLLTMAGLVAATGIAVRWVVVGRLDAVPVWVRVVTGLGLGTTAVLTVLICAEIGSPHDDDGLSLGVDAGSGLLTVLLCAAILLSTEVAHRWEVPQRRG